VINNCVDYVRHRKVQADYEKQVSAQSPGPPVEDNAFEAAHLRKRIESTIAQLPEQMRTIFQLSRFEGLTYRQIAQVLHISIKTVETQMSRALVRLRAQMGDLLPVLVLIGLCNQ
jgi:RNA polymerase sigma-70 factor (ECF subfamily)